MEHLGKPVAIAGPHGERLGDVIDFQFDPLQFKIIFHDSATAAWVEGWRVQDIGDRKPKQVRPVFGFDFAPSLPRDEVTRLFHDVNDHRNIKGWQLFEDSLVEYLHVAPGYFTHQILHQATVDENTTTLSMAKAVSTFFRIWGVVMPCSVAICPSCGVDVVFNPVELECVHRLQLDSAMVVTVRCVCNQFFVVNRSAAALEHIGVTFWNVSFATRPSTPAVDRAEEARDHMSVMRHLHILQARVVAKGGVIHNDTWDIVQRLPVSDVQKIMKSIEHIDDPLEAVVIVRRMSDNLMKDFMMEAPKGFHCVVCGSLQTLRWGWVMPAGRQSGEGCHKCFLGVDLTGGYPTRRANVMYMNAHVFFDGALLHYSVSSIALPGVHDDMIDNP